MASMSQSTVLSPNKAYQDVYQEISNQFGTVTKNSQFMLGRMGSRRVFWHMTYCVFSSHPSHLAKMTQQDRLKECNEIDVTIQKMEAAVKDSFTFLSTLKNRISFLQNEPGISETERNEMVSKLTFWSESFTVLCDNMQEQIGKVGKEANNLRGILNPLDASFMTRARGTISAIFGYSEASPETTPSSDLQRIVKASFEEPAVEPEPTEKKTPAPTVISVLKPPPPKEPPPLKLGSAGLSAVFK